MMIENILNQLGHWNWIVIGIVLLALEIAVPGIFLLWFGLGAIVTGALALMFGQMAFFGWQAQVVLFLILSIVFAYKGKAWMDRTSKSDQPLLNQRDAQLVGRTATLDQPIAEGYGRIRIDGSQWRVKGPDLPAGARVRIAAVQSGDLVVEAL